MPLASRLPWANRTHANRLCPAGRAHHPAYWAATENCSAHTEGGPRRTRRVDVRPGSVGTSVLNGIREGDEARWASKRGRFVAVSNRHEVSHLGITDDELTELALGADPGIPLPEDAVPIGVYLSQFAPPLPLWYMPPVVRSGHRGWKTPVVLAVVFAFVLIDVMGLCNTFGFLSLA